MMRKVKDATPRTGAKNIPKSSTGKSPISLHPLDFEQAIAAAIATGPITDPKLKKRRKSKG